MSQFECGGESQTSINSVLGNLISTSDLNTH